MIIETKSSDSIEVQTKYLTDSRDIIKYLEDTYPDPPLDLSDEINTDWVKTLDSRLVPPFSGLVVSEVPNALPPRSAEYFHKTRSEWLERSLPDYKQQRIKEGAWKELEDGITFVKESLAKSQDKGPFLLGDKVTLADFEIVGYLKWAQYASTPDVYEKILEIGGNELDRFIKAAEPWTSRETH